MDSRGVLRLAQSYFKLDATYVNNMNSMQKEIVLSIESWINVEWNFRRDNSRHGHKDLKTSGQVLSW